MIPHCQRTWAGGRAQNRLSPSVENWLSMVGWYIQLVAYARSGCQRAVKSLSDLHKHTNWPSHWWTLVWEANQPLQWPLGMRCLGTMEAVFSDSLSIYHAATSVSCYICLVCEFLVAGYTSTSRSYDVIFARVSSLGRGCGKSAPRMAEQPFVIEACNFGHICTVWWLIDCSIGWISG